MNNAKVTKQKNMNEMKQKKMMYFLGKMTVNKQSIEEIEAKRKSMKELDIELECCLLMEQLISCLELEETTHKRSTVQNVKKGRK